MGLECECCDVSYESEHLSYIDIKLYGETIRVCNICKITYFTAVPWHGYIILDPSIRFTAHDGTEFTDYSDLSEHLEEHPGYAKASVLGDEMMDPEELYERCETYTWEKEQEHDDETTRYVPNDLYWSLEKKRISSELERLGKRQKLLNDREI